MTHSLNIDIYFDNLDSFLTHVSDTTSLTATVISEKGPAGGNPLVNLSGNRDDIIDIINFLHPNDTDHIEYLTSLIQS